MPGCQSCLAQSREMLGDAWLDTYLTSPVWRFALAPAVCGGAAVAGLVVPSVDRVGRYFPLTVVWPTPSTLSTLEIAVRYAPGSSTPSSCCSTPWPRKISISRIRSQRDGTRRASRTTRRREYSALDASVGRKPGRRAAAATRCVPLRDAAALVAPSLQLYGQFLDAQGSVAFWWTDGSAAVAPSWLTTRGLPGSVQYSAMLDGRWSAAGWDVGEAEAEAVETHDSGATPVPAPAAAASTTASSAHSDRGTVARQQSRCVHRPPGLEVVGGRRWHGGLRDGDVASRMVCDSLANTPIGAGLDEQIEKVIGQLEQVNEYLRRSATRTVNPIVSAAPSSCC